MHEYDEYKRLLIVQCAIERLEGVDKPLNIIKAIDVLNKWVEHRVIEIEKNR